MTRGSGVNGHTVTDLEKTVNLTHCLTGRRGEPVYKCIVDVVRSGALGKNLGHSAKCFKNSISAACNTQKTAKSDLHSIDARYNGRLNSKIDNDRNFLFKLVCVGLCHPAGSVCKAVIAGVCGQICRNHRKRRGICSTLKRLDLSHESIRNKIRVGCIIGVRTELVASNICKSNSRKGLSKNKSADHACKALVVSIDASLTNDRAGKAAAVDILPVVSRKIVKCLNDELGLGLRSIVELSILILACKLLCGGNACDVSIKKTEERVHDIADLDRSHTVSGDLHTVGGIHKTDKHDLNIGISLNDSIDNALVVDKEASRDVCDSVRKSHKVVLLGKLCGNNVNKLCHCGSVDLKNDLASLLGLKKLKRHIKGNYLFLGKRAAHNAESAGDVLYHVRTEGSVTDAKSDDVCILNCCLVVCGECIYVVNVGVVENLAEPTVGGHLAATKEVKKILCAERGNCELGVLYVAVLLEVLLKLQSVRAFAVNAYAIKEVNVVGALLVSLKSVSVSHRVTDGNVVDILVRVGNTCSESGSRKAEEHCACHD